MTTRNLTIRVSPEFHARWMKYLKANNLNGSALIRMLVEDRLLQTDDGNPPCADRLRDCVNPIS
jgi:hypothetical protein